MSSFSLLLLFLANVIILMVINFKREKKNRMFNLKPIDYLLIIGLMWISTMLTLISTAI